MILNIVVECIFIFLATIGFSILFNVKPTELIYCGFTGLVCFIIYEIFLVFLNAEFLGVVLGSFLAVIFARRLAYLRKKPAAMYAIPAIIPLAPGGAVYLTMYNIIYGNYVNAIKNAAITMTIAGGLVIGMSIALSLPTKWFNFNLKKK